MRSRRNGAFEYGKNVKIPPECLEKGPVPCIAAAGRL